MAENSKPTVYGTGLSGMIGSKIVEDLSDYYEFVNLDLAIGVDILQPESIERVLEKSAGVALLHLAAFTDPDAAEAQKGDTSGPAYQVNVVGTRNIAEAAKKFSLHLIHISTAYVFDGTETTPYDEEHLPHPDTWYGETKAEAERVVQEILPSATILRINLPYRTDDFPKPDIWRKIQAALEAGKTGPFFSDHTFTLTPLDWFSQVMRWCIQNQPAGIYHATTSTAYTDLTLATQIRDQLGLSTPLTSSSVHEYNKTATRPYQPYLVLSNEKLQKAMGDAWPAHADHS